MTMGTATVASTKVRGTAGSVRSQPPTARSRAVSGWPCSANFFQGRAVEGRWGSGGDVLGDEVAVECDRECGAFAGGGDDLGAGVDGVACGPDAGDRRSSGGVRSDPAVLVGRAAEGDEQLRVGPEARPDEH